MPQLQGNDNRCKGNTFTRHSKELQNKSGCRHMSPLTTPLHSSAYLQQLFSLTSGDKCLFERS